MKHKLFLRILSCALSVSSCSSDLNVDLDFAGAGSYSKVYMSQASVSPNVKNVYISKDAQKFTFTAFYGGPVPPKNDITVEFEPRIDLVDAYNQKNATSYKAFPEDCISFETLTAVIKAGERSTSPLSVSLDTETELLVAEPYLLPIGIKNVSEGVAVNDDMRVTYFTVSGSYLPGDVPAVLVYDFGAPVSTPMFCRGKDLIHIAKSNGALQLFQLNDSETYDFTREIGQGWGGYDVIFYLADDRFIARNADGNIQQFWVDDDYVFGESAIIGWGWSAIQLIFPFKDIALIGVTDGAMTKYPLSKTGSFDFGNCTGIGSGFNIFNTIFSYGNYLICIQQDGVMAAYPLSDDYVFGQRSDIGTGWGDFVRVFPCEKDLLALDKDGKLWRYPFNPTAYWPLAPEETLEEN